MCRSISASAWASLCGRAVQPRHSFERQFLLALMPFDHAEKHPALEHLGLKVGGVLLPRWRLANTKPWILASLLLRIVGTAGKYLRSEKGG
ncbi:hypothetical protein SAMN05443247_08788 [Bradyrhizobium erythrophlei]|nr:hypothetical protein SAMN05443247_08788 [Bradyrhizobium erythrophlei]